MSNEKVYYATGRRKSSTARVFLKPGSGEITINKKKMDEYLHMPPSRLTINEPFEATSSAGKYDCYITVKGGGESGQAGAIRLGISRALCLEDEKKRPALKKAGLLTRDSREVERKKYGLHGARKSTRFSKR